MFLTVGIEESSIDYLTTTISHNQSNGKAWFDRPFDGVCPEQGRRAQDKLTTSGSAGCSAEAGAPSL